MRKFSSTLAALSVLLLAPLGLHEPLLAQTAAPAQQARVIVKFKADSPLLRRQVQSASPNGERAATLGQRVGLALSAGASVSERAQVVTASGVSSAELARRLAAQSDVEYAEPDLRRHRYAAPNDPRYANGLGGNGPTVGQWYLRAPAGAVRSSIDAEPAWDITTGSNTVVVAVLDTGVRYDHDDLKAVSAGGNLLAGYDMVSDVDTANDGNGRDADPSDPGDWISSADVAGSVFSACTAEDSSWHGTQTASLIGALTNNGLGMASVGRNLRVLPVRVLGKCGGFDSDIIAGMRWAAGLAVPGVPANATPAKVLNLSLGGDGACSQAYQDAVTALNAAGVVVVVSAGNSSGHAVSSPANCVGVIAVTGLRHIGTKVGFADVGTEVTVAAPGGNCVTVAAGDPCQYSIITATNAGTTTPVASSSIYSDSFNASVGTSFSAPMVAGTVGLMFSAQPTMTPANVRAALQGSARSFPNSGSSSGIAACQAPTTADQAECYCTSSTCGAGMLDTGVAVAGAARGLQAHVTLSSETPQAAQSVTLSAANSFVLSPRTLATYQWTLVSGGGIVTALSGSGAAVMAMPTAVGRFTVSLTVVDSTGAQSTTVRAVDVGAPPAPPAPPLIAGDGGGGGGGALGPAWLLGLALGVMALQFQRNQRRRAESMQKAVHRRSPRG